MDGRHAECRALRASQTRRQLGDQEVGAKPLRQIQREKQVAMPAPPAHCDQGEFGLR
jgi:hypothetical protein